MNRIETIISIKIIHEGASGHLCPDALTSSINHIFCIFNSLVFVSVLQYKIPHKFKRLTGAYSGPYCYKVRCDDDGFSA